MNFALLGIDADALALAAHIASSPVHRLVWACDVAGAENQLRGLAPRIQFSSTWESLLAGEGIDALIVARGTNADERADQLRKLVQAPLPMILTHPIDDSMLVGYELDMIRRDSGCPMIPYIATRWDRAIDRLRELVRAGADSPLGPAEQVVMERALADRSRASVQRQFARDVDVLRTIAGDLTSVSALAPGGKEEADYANLGVQLTGEGSVLARWSVAAAEPEAGARLSVRGNRGKASLALLDAGQAAEIEFVIGGQSTREAFPAWNAAAGAIQTLEAAVRGEPVVVTWPDACRNVELTEAIARSLAKGRTIELHDEEHTEHGTFKGTMTSLGCGLLLASLVLLVCAAALAKITGNAFFGYAPYFILAVLGVFLILQSLKLVFPDDA